MNLTKGDIAICRAKRGWPVFPLHSINNGRCTCGAPACTSPGKHPRTAHGLNDSTLDVQQVLSWWEQYPDANIGIATGSRSGLAVLDVDPRHGGVESLQSLEKEHGVLPDGPRVKTGGGGFHVYFEYRAADIRSRAGVRPGLDLRAEGGYVVGSGSTHVTGRIYNWLKRKALKDLPIPALPGWLKSVLADGTHTRVVSASAHIPAGERNASLASLAGAMRRQGAPEATILAALRSCNAIRCKPPLSDKEVEGIAASISRYEPGIHSAQPTEEVRAERILRFQTAAEIATATPEQVAWISRPWVAAGSLTELDAKVKSGKTTLVMHLVRSVLEGGLFLGEPTMKTSVVYLSEQPVASFRPMLERAGLLGCDNLHILFWQDAITTSWPEIAHRAVQRCQECGAKLLVVDTIAQFAKLRGDSENNAGDALLAMLPLQEAAGAGIGVVISRHERKSGGDVGDSGRGSSAFAGVMDTIISLRKPEGKSRASLRVIHAVSRFSDVPEELVIELTKEGFVPHGTTENVATAEARQAILAELPREQKDAMTINELLSATATTRATAQRVIEELRGEGRVCRAGAGKKGDPCRYWAAPDDSAQTSSSNEHDETGEASHEAGDASQEPETAKMRWARERLEERLAQAEARRQELQVPVSQASFDASAQQGGLP